jgi:hypothetical protein
VFLNRYDRIATWAQQLAGSEGVAENLIQDTYIHFTAVKPDLSAIRWMAAGPRRILPFSPANRRTAGATAAP